MFLIDNIKAKQFGNALRQLRIEKDLSFRDVDRLSGVDISTINRLEEGRILRLNVKHLNAIAKAYDVNPLSLLKIIDYVNDEDIQNYVKLNNFQQSAYKNKEIEVFNHKGDSYYPKKFIKLPYDVQYKAIEYNEYIFLYSSDKLSYDDLGIFFYNNKVLIAYYHCLNDVLSLKDFFSDSTQMFYKNDIEIWGKIETFIKFSINKK